MNTLCPSCGVTSGDGLVHIEGCEVLARLQAESRARTKGVRITRSPEQTPDRGALAPVYSLDEYRARKSAA